MAATYLDEVTADLPPAESEPDLIVASRLDETLITVRKWVQSGSAPSWSDCAGLSPEFTVLAVTIWKFVDRYGRSSMAPPCSSGDNLSAGGTSQ